LTFVELDDEVLPVVLAAPPDLLAVLPVVPVVPPEAVSGALPRVPPDAPDEALLSVELPALPEGALAPLEAEPDVVPLDVPDAAPPAAPPEPEAPPGVVIVEPPEAPPEAPPELPPLEPPLVWAMAATLKERAAAATVAIKVVRIERSPMNRVPARALCNAYQRDVFGTVPPLSFGLLSVQLPFIFMNVLHGDVDLLRDLARDRVRKLKL
jgi:hypothetical protein